MFEYQNKLTVFRLYSFKFLMFSKIKSYFSGPASAQAAEPHFEHPKMDGGDVSQCPFMSKNKNANMANPEDGKQPKQKKDKKNKNDSDTESEAEEKPRGGCPFMVSSGTKKNPNLGIEQSGFDEPFVSKFKYYLSSNKVNFDAIKNGKKSQQPTVRHVFDQYPIYLRHTLFYNGEDFKKVRTFQCCSRFLAYEELREKGNKHFNKGRFIKAIDYYERAMSLFRWLEYKEQEPESETEPENSQLMIQESASQSQISEDESMGSRIPIKVDNEKMSMGDEKEKNEFDDFREKYKEFFVVYHDDNVAYFNGEEMTETVDLDMRKSLLAQIYLNMAAAYIKLNHFSLAKMVLNDASILCEEKVSQIFLRKAQVALSNKSSSLKELESGMKDIERAIEMQPHEKIFQNTNPNILKMVNIHDAKEVYADVREKIGKQIEEKTKEMDNVTKSIENRLKTIYKIEQDMIKEGKTPQEGRRSGLLSEGTDFKILSRIYDKYVRIMEFYTEAKDKSQIDLAKKEFQEVLRVLSEIRAIENIEINTENPEFGNDSSKIQNRIKNIKRQKCEDIYNGARYNFHVLEWAIKEVVAQEHEEKERQRKQEEAKQQEQKQHQVQEKPNLMSKLPYAMVLVPVIGIMINFLI